MGTDIDCGIIQRARKILEVEAMQHILPHMLLRLGTLGPPVTAQGEEDFLRNVSFTVLDFVLHDSGPINHYDVILW